MFFSCQTDQRISFANANDWRLSVLGIPNPLNSVLEGEREKYLNHEPHEVVLYCNMVFFINNWTFFSPNIGVVQEVQSFFSENRGQQTSHDKITTSKFFFLLFFQTSNRNHTTMAFSIASTLEKVFLGKVFIWSRWTPEIKISDIWPRRILSRSWIRTPSS